MNGQDVALEQATVDLASDDAHAELYDLLSDALSEPSAQPAHDDERKEAA